MKGLKIKTSLFKRFRKLKFLLEIIGKIKNILKNKKKSIVPGYFLDFK
jgi:hypothetical protein